MCYPAIQVASNETYCYRIYLKDKGTPAKEYILPEGILSEEAIAKRAKRGIFTTASDLPISSSYIQSILSTGVQLVTQSKWMQTVVIESRDTLAAKKIQALPMVDSVKLVWQGMDRLKWNKCGDEHTVLTSGEEKNGDSYGCAQEQIEMLNGMYLHESGKRGRGIRIAVIDAGFLNVDRIDAFASLRLIGTYNAVFPGGNVFCDDDHGTKVLSCMAADLPGIMIGTAPEASYLLIKSEDVRSEYPIEEDYWAAALEYADSMGVDIITSSLGYSRFDMPHTVYTATNLDGKTAFITQVAEKAAQKGLMLFCSAGNEGNHNWQKITFPGDAPNVLTVGAVETDRERSAFSSTGLTADYRIKPDVVALGTGVCVINGSGNIQHINGTSFATPVTAGLGACLWQALPWLTGNELRQLIRQTASQASRPDTEKGYGIPDMQKAYRKEMNGPVQ
jgi:subtilisin family serine protease